MMLSDAPRYVEKKVGDTNHEKSAEDEAEEIAGYFRSNLKQ